MRWKWSPRTSSQSRSKWTRISPRPPHRAQHGGCEKKGSVAASTASAGMVGAPTGHGRGVRDAIARLPCSTQGARCGSRSRRPGAGRTRRTRGATPRDAVSRDAVSVVNADSPPEETSRQGLENLSCRLARERGSFLPAQGGDAWPERSSLSCSSSGG